MCGIVGVAAVRPIEQTEWLAAGIRALHHRGPDDSGEWWADDHRVGLGHRRLSILDLTAAGHQPMHLAGRPLSVVLNGEIYNFREVRASLEAIGYRFRSQGDTEVLLAAYDAWGTECLDRLNGMFAFALFDGDRRRVFLARDRVGEKPLFFHHADGQLRFASELKALLADPAMPRRVDPAALDCYLGIGYVPGAGCILAGYQKLPAAHAALFDLSLGTLRTWAYWSLPPVPGDAVPPEDGLVDELEALLEGAVHRQLVADVPVGVLLSGGVDSSLITALAARRASRVKTFSVTFPGHGVADEAPHARLIASAFGTDHVELPAEPATSDLVERLARQYDEPIVDSSMIPTYLVSQLVRQHCTVALGGDGGDELFGGYGHHNRLLQAARAAAPVPLAARKALAAVTGALLPTGFKGRNWLQAYATDFRTGLPVVATVFDRGERRRLLPGLGNTDAATGAMVGRNPPGDLIQRATRVDFLNYLPEDILVKVDRASMLTSLEVRAPFLDRHVVEFAFGRVPSALKTTPHQRKIMLKRLCVRLLPPAFDLQRKQGFGIPIREWLRHGPFRDLFWGVLLDPALPFDRPTVQRLLEGQDRGLNNGERLFGLVMFELWRRHYGIVL